MTLTPQTGKKNETVSREREREKQKKVKEEGLRSVVESNEKGESLE